MLNEIVTNSMKHAFSGTQYPEIRISASEEGGRIRLRCGDNGSGLAPGAEKASGGLGSELIEMLASQIGVEVAVSSGPGLSYDIDIPAAGAALGSEALIDTGSGRYAERGIANLD